MNNKLTADFFRRDVLDVAPDLLGKILGRRFSGQWVEKFLIAEVEAYRGGEDKACHANKGKTARTEVMFREGGVVYVYLVYGIHWMLNFVAGEEEDASAVLIRGLNDISGPGRVGKALQLDNSFYGENLATSDRLWVENSGNVAKYKTAPRIGIHYAGEPWVSKKWRYILKNQDVV
jgi:DNA-3-methyladenine glycosylase